MISDIKFKFKLKFGFSVIKITTIFLIVQDTEKKFYKDSISMKLKEIPFFFIIEQNTKKIKKKFDNLLYTLCPSLNLCS